ncbi:hypothetical protein [Oceaniradius stylonematis]|jgi:hypothetical protein|nr:hypothetical protein [Oceaniradius stylonematis]
MMGNGMMDSAWGMGGMGLIGLLVLVFLVLGVAALIKYLMR